LLRVTCDLPFEDPGSVVDFFKTHTNYDFYLYAPYYKEDLDMGHIHQRKISTQGFKADLHSASGVICNAGFETPSECLQLGKRLLVKPVHQQMEQLSNALAIQQLKLGVAMKTLDADVLENWLNKPIKQVKIHYPDIAGAITQWILNGDWNDIHTFANKLWNETSPLSLTTH